MSMPRGVLAALNESVSHEKSSQKVGSDWLAEDTVIKGAEAGCRLGLAPAICANDNYFYLQSAYFSLHNFTVAGKDGGVSLH